MTGFIPGGARIGSSWPNPAPKPMERACACASAAIAALGSSCSTTGSWSTSSTPRRATAGPLRAARRRQVAPTPRPRPTILRQPAAAAPRQPTDAGGTGQPRPEFLQRVENLSSAAPGARPGVVPDGAGFNPDHLERMIAWAIEQGHLTGVAESEGGAARPDGPAEAQALAAGAAVPGLDGGRRRRPSSRWRPCEEPAVTPTSQPGPPSRRNRPSHPRHRLRSRNRRRVRREPARARTTPRSTWRSWAAAGPLPPSSPEATGRAEPRPCRWSRASRRRSMLWRASILLA